MCEVSCFLSTVEPGYNVFEGTGLSERYIRENVIADKSIFMAKSVPVHMLLLRNHRKQSETPKCNIQTSILRKFTEDILITEQVPETHT